MMPMVEEVWSINIDINHISQHLWSKKYIRRKGYMCVEIVIGTTVLTMIASLQFYTKKFSGFVKTKLTYYHIKGAFTKCVHRLRIQGALQASCTKW